MILLKQIPNLLTVFRLVLLVPIYWAIDSDYFFLGFMLFLLAGLSDALDGYLARRWHSESTLGALLDPLADKLLMWVTLIALCQQSLVSWVLFALLLLRDLCIVTGAGFYFIFFGAFKPMPNVISKINTLVQITVLSLLLLQLATHWSLQPLLTFGWCVLMTTTLFSLLAYIWTWSRLAKRQLKAMGTNESLNDE